MKFFSQGIFFMKKVYEKSYKLCKNKLIKK